MGGIEGGTRKTYPLIPFVGEEIQVATRFKWGNVDLFLIVELASTMQIESCL
jgi:hypothetical protein